MGRQKGYTMLTVDMDLNITVRLELAVVDQSPKPSRLPRCVNAAGKKSNERAS